MKKTLSILVALCLLLSCVSAFADNPTISQLAINSYYSTVDLKDAYLLKKIADNAGVTVDWNLLDPGTYAEAVSPMLAAGQDLADVIMLPDLDTNQTYLSAGLFEPLDTHFDIMPNYKKFLDENPIIKGSLTAVDGHIYYVPQTVVTNNYQPVLMYNVRWLEKAGLEAPTTLDAFVEMLKYYKDNDMNGNGDTTDEIPMSIQSAFLPYMFGPAFGLDLVSGFYADDAGVVHYAAYESEAYKAYLTFLNGLYNDGLLEVEFTSLNRDQIVERCANDTTGVTFDFSWQMSTLYSQNAPGYDGEHGIFVGVAPLSGEQKGFYVGRNPVSNVFGINAKSQNMEAAIKYLDYAMGEEAQDLYVWGEEGLTYEVDAEGNRHFLPRTTEDSTWFQGLGINAPNMPSQQSVPATDVLLAAWHVQNDREFEEPYIRAPFPNVYSTTEEANTLSMYMVDLQTYVDERMVGFISGSYSIADEFDSYIEALKGLQIEELLKVKQAQYDRFAAAQ